MRLLLCGTVLATVFIGGFGFPTNPKADENSEKQPKQSSLFGVGFDYNFSKNSSFLPIPSFLNVNGNYENGAGVNSNLIVPLAFPLGLIFPVPPLNLSLGINANKNVSFGLNAQPVTYNDEVDNGWGWDSSPPASGWNAPPASGWTTAPPATGWTTGWTTTTAGWTTPPPTTTSGWQPPPPTTTPGWQPPPPTTTPGWQPPPPGWKSPESEKLEKEFAQRNAPGKAPPPSQPGPSRPVPSGGAGAAGSMDKPKPQANSKPIPQIENLPGVPDDKGSENQNYIMDVAQSSLSSELPAQAEQAQGNAVSAQVNHENELSNAQPLLPGIEVDSSAPEAASTVAEASGSVQPVAHSIENPFHPQNVQFPAPIVPIVASKSRRHAGVEIPASLRIEDFEDVEVAHEQAFPESPVNHESAQQGGEEISKEEMILIAMEQLSTQLPAGVQFSLGRPSGSSFASRPNALSGSNAQSQTTHQTVNKPVESQDFSEESEFAEKEEDSSEESSSEEESEAPIDSKLSEKEVSSSPSKSIPKGAESGAVEKPGRNKPRPYGMDRPSKNKPHSEGGIKNEHFGLPHYSPEFQQKNQDGIQLGTANVMGFQIPYMKWSSFSDIFQHFMGSRHRKTGMGKSDATDAVASASEKCVDDEEDSLDSTRSQVIHSGSLCTNNEKLMQCNEACKSRGFSSGTCLGPANTPGCLCKLPNHKEYGMMLNPLKPEDKRDHNDDLVQSTTHSCKKCDCEDSCKKSGAFTGFCIGKCYCANPWYTKV